jgi:hypothetical protein
MISTTMVVVRVSGWLRQAVMETTLPKLLAHFVVFHYQTLVQYRIAWPFILATSGSYLDTDQTIHCNCSVQHDVKLEILHIIH